ncbi:MAG TPA: site-specific DNA-methyltransferase [Fimbriimonadaceae bacterium]|nr:site-specific DNA-methyltransferase [Fimbriimonadaceae bacterium]
MGSETKLHFWGNRERNPIPHIGILTSTLWGQKTLAHLSLTTDSHEIQNQASNSFDLAHRAVIFEGDCLDLLASIPTDSIQLIVTSPPYNIGKEYEHRVDLNKYLLQQQRVIAECHRVLRSSGSICWQVGNFVDRGSVIPLDTLLFPAFNSLGMKMRNRIIWHFEHGLHCANRLSGRYETIMWFTKSDDYIFNLDPIRVPQKYPGKKHFKGPRAGEYSGNPLGKNPGDVWVFPNVKSNHVEKTDHPCQYPVELVERLVLSLTKRDDWVLDPFLGSGTTVVAALLHDRRGAGSEMEHSYCKIARDRYRQLLDGTLRTRAMNEPVFDPKKAGKSLTQSPWQERPLLQDRLLEQAKDYESR